VVIVNETVLVSKVVLERSQKAFEPLMIDKAKKLPPSVLMELQSGGSSAASGAQASEAPSSGKGGK
jgi:hypothetical protein